MCDGITQGQDGMDLSLFSRDVIALSTAVSLSHNMFDGTLCLGICDKIVPGLLIGSLAFGHLPTIFVPAGPMPSGLPNKEKAQVREAYAAGQVGRDALLAAESAAYHAPGTCTFYGTANSNQMLLEFMGLQLPGGSFINPENPLRPLLTDAAVGQLLALVEAQTPGNGIGHLLDARAVVNGIVGLLATGGSTNHTIHLVAIAAAAGLEISWSDMAELSKVVPLLARVYPNGAADVNAFHDAGGLPFMIRELLAAGLLHEDVQTIVGPGLSRFATTPELTDDRLSWAPAPDRSGDYTVLRKAADPFQAEGGIALVEGDLGRAVVKVSAVASEHRSITAPARVFTSQDAFVAAYQAGTLEGDFVAVLSFQGPVARGMPELHQLTPYLAVLQDRGAKVALVTDGRMSGASGKVLAALHLSPEAAAGGAIAKIRDGDLITVDAENGLLSVNADLEGRPAASLDLSSEHAGMGRELFSAFRTGVGPAETGACLFPAAGAR
jgi:phosphogluconate dehydratase